MISVTAHVNTDKLLAFVPFANAGLRELTDDARQHGELYMSSIVPHGRTNRLAASVVSSIYSVTDAHHIGSIGVDERVAPYANYVDKGTGVDGPFRKPVTVTRPARSNRRRSSPRERARPGRSQAGERRYKASGQNGVMTFQKNGEPRRFRKTVKATSSLKIQRGKNFSGRTQDEVVHFTRIRTGVLSQQLALFFTDAHI